MSGAGSPGSSPLQRQAPRTSGGRTSLLVVCFIASHKQHTRRLRLFLGLVAQLWAAPPRYPGTPGCTATEQSAPAENPSNGEIALPLFTDLLQVTQAEALTPLTHTGPWARALRPD